MTFLKKFEKELSKEVLDLIEKAKKKNELKENLIYILHMTQKEKGFLKESQLEALSYLMNIPLADISGVATFYHLFRIKPMGK